MEGLKVMADNAMGDDRPQCDQCGDPIEWGNTGTVCHACTKAMLFGGHNNTEWVGDKEYIVADDSESAPYSAPTRASVVCLAINGRNLHVTAMRSLGGLAADIKGSMTPAEVRVLVELLTPPLAPAQLPGEFWDAIKLGRNISAIKELRKASNLDLRSSKKIVDTIMDKPESEDKGADAEPSESKDGDQGEPEPGDEPGVGEPQDGESPGEGDEPGDGDGQADAATMAALADLAKRSFDNGKDYSEEEIRAALATLGIQF